MPTLFILINSIISWHLWLFPDIKKIGTMIVFDILLTVIM